MYSNMSVICMYSGGYMVSILFAVHGDACATVLGPQARTPPGWQPECCQVSNIVRKVRVKVP